MEDYAIFTPEMKETHTILIPNMLPIQFRLLISVFESYGYHFALLESESRTVVEEGLKNVHNDTCYPALLCIGQFMRLSKAGNMTPTRPPSCCRRPAAAAGLPTISICCASV